jgi:hypothetical protein
VSSTEVINHVNTTLYNILRQALESLDPELNITFGSPADEEGSGDTPAKLLVFLYNIIEDQFSRNRPDEYRGGNRPLSFKPPLAVNLYYMLTPFSGPSGSTDTNARIRVQAHNMIALAMRAFHDNGVIDPKFFPPNTALGESQVRISSVQMNLEEITKIWSSFNKPFKLSVCYEVSIVQIQSEATPKEVHIVERTALRNGDGESESEFGVIPAIGKRNLSNLKNKGWNLIAMRSDEIVGISDVSPPAVQPGMALSIFGRNFKNKKLTVKIGDKIITDGGEIDAQVNAEVDKVVSQGTEIDKTLLRTLLRTLLERLLGTGAGEIEDTEINAEVDKVVSQGTEIDKTLLRTLLRTLLERLLGTSFRVIAENLIKVKIPPDEKEGTKILSLKLEDGEGEGEEVITTFDVLLIEPSSIRITEIRPDKGITPGDVIAVFGINLSEPLEVSVSVTTIDDEVVTKKVHVTFVNNSQINIMIPEDTPVGKAKLTVKADQKTTFKEFIIQKRDQ